MWCCTTAGEEEGRNGGPRSLSFHTRNPSRDTEIFDPHTGATDELMVFLFLWEMSTKNTSSVR